MSINNLEKILIEFAGMTACGYTTPRNSHKVLDSELLIDIEAIIKPFLTKVYNQARQEVIETCIQAVGKEPEGWYDAGEGLDIEYSAREMKDAIIKALSFLKDKSITPIEEIPQMKGTLEALDKLTIRTRE